MPELDGIETAGIVKKEYPGVKIIMLTQFGERRLPADFKYPYTIIYCLAPIILKPP